uniref:UPAR/Ly6 domain-containing protein n=1 Tax=Salarias fasciatus TaxID=181472 RepID=A0A672GQK8_SALFA
NEALLGICLLVFSALIGLGADGDPLLHCKDYTASCTKQDCSYENACLTLNERGGMTYRQCLKYSDCVYSRLGPMFPQASKLHFKCCDSDLCNSAPSLQQSSLIGLLTSLVVMWWCLH